MNYSFNKYIQDTRAFEDQHPDGIIQQLQQPIKYFHRFDPLAKVHTFRFQGFFSGFIPRSEDFDSQLFVALRGTEPIEDKDLQSLIGNFQTTITLPVPSSEDTYLKHTLKYNVMLAWIGRANYFLQEPWASCSRQPLNLCYYDTEKGLDRFFTVLKETDTLQNFFGCPCYILPSVSSIDLVPIIHTRSMKFNDIIWFERHEFETKFNADLIQPGEYLPFHVCWTYDTPHCIWFKNRKDVVRYLISKAKENVHVARQFYESTPGPINRPSEAVAMHSTDAELEDLISLASDIELSSKIFQQVTLINETTFWRTFVKESNLKRRLSENVVLSEKELQILRDSGRPFWDKIELMTNQERENQISASTSVLGTEKPAFGTISWIELPLGEEFGISYDRLQATTLSSSEYLLEPTTQDQSNIEDHLGKGVCFIPNTNVLPLTHATTDLQRAQSVFDAIKTNCVWCVSQNSRYLEKVSQSLSNLRQGLLSQSKGPVPLYSNLYMLQNLLFNENPTRGLSNIAAPSSDAKQVKINNSSIKLLSVFKYLLDGAYNLEDFNIEVDRFENEAIPKVKKILVVGTINDPFVECLRRAYPTISVKGFGADAQGKNLRACIEGVGGKNMSCDILISDVDQTYYDTYVQMEDSTVSQILSFLSWSPVAAVKLNYPTQRLFNAISAAVKNAFPNQEYQGYPVSVSAQNPFSTECFFFLYPNYYVSSHAELFIYIMDETLFTFKSVQINRSKVSMSTQPSCIGTVIDKTGLSLYDPADSCVRACPQPQNRLSGGSYFALTTHINRAQYILPILLESCDVVETWKVSVSSELVHFLGTVSNFRLSITKRSNSHYYLNLQSRGFGVNSYGVRNSPPRMAVLRVVPWYTIVSESSRAMLMRICERDSTMQRVFSIGSRNLTDMFVLRNYEDVTCYDEYRSGGPEIFRKYNFHVEEKYFDWEHATLKENLFILANFVIMAPERGRNAVSKEHQIDIISKMSGNMSTCQFNHVSFGFSYYLSYYAHLFPKASVSPEGLRCSSDPPSVSFGDYEPVACLGPEDIDNVVANFPNLSVKYYTPSFSTLFLTCATHGWVPNAASAPAITLFRHLVQLCVITKNVATPDPTPPVSPRPSVSSDRSADDVIVDDEDTLRKTDSLQVPTQASNNGQKAKRDLTQAGPSLPSSSATQLDSSAPSSSSQGTIPKSSPLNQFVRKASG